MASDGPSGLRLGVATGAIILLLGVTWGFFGTRWGFLVAIVATVVVAAVTVPLAVKWCRAPAKRA